MAININGTGSITGLSSISSPTISGGSVPLGDATAPGIVFSGDPNTGIYSPGADQVAISTGGSGRLFINSSGDIGLGTNSPDAFGRFYTRNIGLSSSGSTAIQINSATGSSAIIDLGVNAARTAGITSNISETTIATLTATPLVFQTNGGERLRITAAGLVGIGTSSPSTKTHLYDASNVALKIESGGANYVETNFINTSAAYTLGIRPDTSNSLCIRDNTASATRVVLDSSGRLGIGTTSPAARLHVSSSGTGTSAGSNIVISARSEASGRDAAIQFADGTTSAYVGMLSGAIYFADAGSTERARIDSSGRLLVGTTSASSADSSANPLLQVTGRIVAKSDATYSSTAAYGFAFRNSTNLYNMVWGGYDNTADLGFIQATYEGTAHKPFAINPNGGEVRVGGITDQGAYNLQCNGTGVWGAGAYVNGSDERLKENIQDLEPALDVIKSMRPVSFKYKEHYSKDQSIQPGFIAQELQQAMANTAYVDGIVQAGPEYLNVAYQGIIAILVKAVQELEAKVAALESA